MSAALNAESRNGVTGKSERDCAPIPHRRPRKAIIESDPEDEEEPRDVAPPSSVSGPTFNMDTDISQLEAPTFTTLDRGPSQKMMELSWDHKVNLIGKKVVNPMIHNCDKCAKPILIYGRMIPCKHVFCYKCAQSERTQCPRCKDKVGRVEQAGLGSIYMCSHGGSRYGSNGCRRTYLSQRDLQAHIHHRHVKQQSSNSHSAASLPAVPSAAAIAAATAAIVADRKKTEALAYDGRSAPVATVAAAPFYSQPPPNAHGGGGHHAIPARSSQQSSNLITVPIQDTSGWTSQHPQQTYSQPPPNYYPSQNIGVGAAAATTGGSNVYQYQASSDAAAAAAANAAANAPNSSSYDNNGQWPNSGRTSYYNRR